MLTAGDLLLKGLNNPTTIAHRLWPQEFVLSLPPRAQSHPSSPDKVGCSSQRGQGRPHYLLLTFQRASERASERARGGPAWRGPGVEQGRPPAWTAACFALQPQPHPHPGGAAAAAAPPSPSITPRERRHCGTSSLARCGIFVWQSIWEARKSSQARHERKGLLLAPAPPPGHPRARPECGWKSLKTCTCTSSQPVITASASASASSPPHTPQHKALQQLRPACLWCLAAPLPKLGRPRWKWPSLCSVGPREAQLQPQEVGRGGGLLF